MVKFLKVNKNGTITLPRETLKAFPALTEMIVWWQGDSLVLKRVSPVLSSEFAERSPGKEMSMSALVKEVRKVRREKKRG